MVRRQPDGPEATFDGPEATLMVRRQQHFPSVLLDGPEATFDGPEATLMVRRQQHFCPLQPVSYRTPFLRVSFAFNYFDCLPNFI